MHYPFSCKPAFCLSPSVDAGGGENNNAKRIVRYIFGILLILLGILPYLCKGDYGEYQMYIQKTLSEYYVAGYYVAAVNLLISFFTFLSPLFYFLSSVCAVFVGAMIIKYPTLPSAPTVLCLVSQLSVIARTLIINVWIYISPAVAVSLFTSDEGVLDAADEILRANPGLLYYHQEYSLIRGAFSVAVIIACAVFAAISFKNSRSRAKASGTPSGIGSILFFVSMAVISVIQNSAVSAVVRRFIGDDATMAYGLSGNVMGRFSAVFLVIILISVLAGVLAPGKSGWVRGIISALIVIASAVMMICVKPVVRELGTPNQVLELTLHTAVFRLIAAALFLIAMLFWITAVQKGRLPLWAEIAVPVAITVIFPVVEFVAIALFKAGSCVNFFGTVAVSAVTLASALLLRKKQKEPR